mmetsp:Transcript_43293/g.109618  ORF Transcript_43293/g.109618 Transcript_43293/m.109618 type:complete len:312 (+) Transcript_43293:221-1156(+)|eukprot:jgi/Tetstr1/434862/TSEL_002576.t1
MVASVVAAAAWPGLPLQELREYAAAPSRRRQPTTLAFGNVGTRLPLLQFSHDVALQRFAKGTARFAGRSRRLARTSACKSEGAEDIPQEVVDAEERSASGRNYRLAAFAAFGGLGAALTLTRIALNVTATPITNDFLQPSLFGELLDIIVVGTAGILWNSELSTKEENIQRIWDELKRRRAESGPQYVGKDDLRKRKKDKKGGQKRTKGFSQEMREMRMEQRQELAAKRGEEGTEERPLKGTAQMGKQGKKAGATGGLIGGLKAAYDSANSAGRIQALQVNDALEEAGLLKPLASDQDDEDSGEDSSKPSQ